MHIYTLSLKNFYLKEKICYLQEKFQKDCV